MSDAPKDEPSNPRPVHTQARVLPRAAQFQRTASIRGWHDSYCSCCRRGRRAQPRLSQCGPANVSPSSFPGQKTDSELSLFFYQVTLSQQHCSA